MGSGSDSLAPLTPSNLSLNLSRLAAQSDSQATAWAESSLNRVGERAISGVTCISSSVAAEAQLALPALDQARLGHTRATAPVLFGITRASLATMPLATSVRQARFQRQQLAGDTLGVIGGEARSLGLNDTAVNTASTAFEWARAAAVECGVTHIPGVLAFDYASGALAVTALKGGLRGDVGFSWFMRGAQPHTPTPSTRAMSTLGGLETRPLAL